MENKDHNSRSKALRPLPTAPGNVPPAQRPNTPVNGSDDRPVPSNHIYDYQKPPPLPDRPKQAGSSHTVHSMIPPAPPSTDHGQPPGYMDSQPNSYKEPELIADTTWKDSPEFEWGATNTDGWLASDSQWNASVKAAFPGTQTEWIPTHLQNVPIDNRDTVEEESWWDPNVRSQKQRPGYGLLAPLVAEEIHDSNHILFHVSVQEPDISTSLASSSKSRQNSSLPPSQSDKPQRSSPPGTTSTPPNTSPSRPPPQIPPPSVDELRQAVPHPNAYYCPRENGWVILSWKSSSVAPPLANSFQQQKPCPVLPNQEHRKRVTNCLESSPVGAPSNKTHHFHKYLAAVDAHKLTPPFRTDEWDAPETVKRKRRVGAIVEKEEVDERMRSERDSMLEEDPPPEEEGKLMNLYMCCQCSFYIVASEVIPGVVPATVWQDFIQDKKENPAPGKPGEFFVFQAMSTMLTALENKLWKSQNRQLRVSSPSFQRKIGWSPNVKRFFEALGFAEEKGDEVTLRAPQTDPSTQQGRLNRARLLRAWVEIGAFCVNFSQIHKSKIEDQAEHKAHPLWVKLDPSREKYQDAIGAHPDQIPRVDSEAEFLLRVGARNWRACGLTPFTFSPDLLTFAYYAQCRCDPANTVQYFSILVDIVEKLLQTTADHGSLQDAIPYERSRNRFIRDEVQAAVTNLGFGPDGALRIEYDSDVSDDFVENAYLDKIKRAWKDNDEYAASTIVREANESLKILSETRGSLYLRRVWEDHRNRSTMSPEKAYEAVGISADVDEDTIVTVFEMQMMEATELQKTRVREALGVISEERDSERLKTLYQTGSDPGDLPPRFDLPRGLDQLGNTCYLNSLLQYFYTIKDLRDAVLPYIQLDLKASDDDKLTDDELKKHRVGGRNVSRREIIRSKKFVSQLAGLFSNLESEHRASVKPTMELAKLALVTSRDEEEDDVDRAGTDSSNDTDATLVEDGSASGKRGQNSQWTEMDVDMVTSPDKENADPSGNKNTDIDMATPELQSKPPPLPARKKSVVIDNSVMMFGRQHDVAECMDNCMFQIETALLKFEGASEWKDDNDIENRSLMKRLFYGKTRQQVAMAAEEKKGLRASMHVKEDLFAHLLVNVAADDGIDIYDGLHDFLEDTVELNGRIGRMETTLVDLPPLLQIQLQRVQWDRETLQQYKSQAYVKFGETIYMDRFLYDIDPKKKARSRELQAQLSACRERARALVKGKDGMSYRTALENTESFLNQQSASFPDVDEDLLTHLRTEQHLISSELTSLHKEIDTLKTDLETLWSDPSTQKTAYELTSVFIHRGTSPSFGHYFFYSRNLPDRPDEWFKYNDETVEVVRKEEVMRDTTGDTANPYLLVFARKGSQVVDTVNRLDTSAMDTA